MSTKQTKQMHKTLDVAEIKFDDGSSPGSFTAKFATLGVIDKDNDVITPGSIGEARTGVRISSWGHKWQDLPVGKGQIYESDGSLYCTGQFFLDTPHGDATYKTVKGLGDLCEWSFGFDITDSAPGQLDGRPVRMLKGMRVFEVSPVLQGAGIGTQTIAVKASKDMALTFGIDDDGDVRFPCPACGETLSLETAAMDDAEDSAGEDAPAPTITAGKHAKGALPYKDSKKAPEDTAWDGPKVMSELDGKDQLRMACAWVDDSGDPEAKSSYKLPHHLPSGEVVWKGVAAAMGALLGSRGGAQIPSGDRKAVYNHLAKHYAQFGKQPPDFKESSLVCPYCNNLLPDGSHDTQCVYCKMPVGKAVDDAESKDASDLLIAFEVTQAKMLGVPIN